MKIQDYKNRYIKYESYEGENSVDLSAFDQMDENLTQDIYGIPVYKDSGEPSMSEKGCAFLISQKPDGIDKDVMIQGYKQAYGIEYPGDEIASTYYGAVDIPATPNAGTTDTPDAGTTDTPDSEGIYIDPNRERGENEYGVAIYTDTGEPVLTAEEYREKIENNDWAPGVKEKKIDAFEKTYGISYADGTPIDKEPTGVETPPTQDTDEIIVSSSAKEPAESILNTNTELNSVNISIRYILNELKEYWSEEGLDQQSFYESLIQDSEYIDKIMECNKQFATATVDYVNTTENIANQTVE